MPASRRGSSTSLRGALATKQSTLSFRGGVDCFACARNHGEGVWPPSCQGFVEVLPRHCEERSDEAIHSFFSRRRGLLRCARNDGEGVWSASCQRFVEVLPR